ncbi:hypothetical protein AB0E01_22900 [Nocardia vinacea]|uniref:hypothetical protein n=1 Tax=Nocardia vinacea TaxID=96468 RepID=UPI0033C041B9
MTYEEFMQKHSDVVREALSVYVNKMDANVDTLEKEMESSRARDPLVETFQQQKRNGLNALAELGDIQISLGALEG